MPNWKKLITSGSDAVLNDITASGEIQLSSDNKIYFGASSEIESTTSGTKLLLNASDEVHLRRGSSTILKVQNGGVEVTGQLNATQQPVQLHTNGEVLKASEITGYVPFANINQIDGDVRTGYWQYLSNFDGYVEQVIVTPHQSATSGTVGLTWKNQSGNLGAEVNGTISGTAGSSTGYSFGSSYSFSGGDKLNLFIDRGASARSRGFGFTIVLRIDFVG